MSIKIIGIDPGLHHLGWAVIKIIDNQTEQIESVKHGIIKTSPKNNINDRLHEIHKRLELILEQFQPEFIGIETPFIHKGMKANINFIKACGVISAACRGHNATYVHNNETEVFHDRFNFDYNIPKIVEITPAKIKKIIGGSGRSSKESIATMVNLLISNINNTNLTSHEFDAYAIAYCCYLDISKLN